MELMPGRAAVIGLLGKGDDFLPAVQEEGATVARILDVVPELMDDFEASDLDRVLADRPDLIHVAGHFDLHPGHLARSGWRLKGGKLLSLGMINAGRFDLSGIGLMVLSGCETGLVGLDPNGLDSLAGVLMGQGVLRILATLWPIPDAAAASLGCGLQETESVSQNFDEHKNTGLEIT